MALPPGDAKVAVTALLWDMDGVLADVSNSYRTAIVQTAEHFGAAATDADVHAAKLEGNANNDWELTRRLIARSKTGDQLPSLERVTEVFQGFYLGGLRDREKLITPKERLQALAACGPMAVVTGRPRAEAHYFLELHGISGLFKEVVCMEDGPAKPDPFPVLHAIEKLRTLSDPAPARFIMFGDTVDDMRAASAAHARLAARGKAADGSRLSVVGVGVLPPGRGSIETNMEEVAALYASAAWRVCEDGVELLDYIDECNLLGHQSSHRGSAL